LSPGCAAGDEKKDDGAHEAILAPVPRDFLAEEALPHKTWTREEPALVEATGNFEGTHFELIEGELIDKMSP
jgi:hypothetical protein